jgi:hypothetical protein
LPLASLLFTGAFPPDRTRLIQALRDAPGPVLTQKDSLAVLLAGKEPIAGDPYGVALFALAGRWNSAPLNRLIERREFAVIVLNQSLEETATYDGQLWWPPGSVERMQQMYTFDRRLGEFHLYVPRTDLAQQARP